MKAETGNDIRKAAALLADNELVAIPTETVYGLAANALSEMAVVKIFEAKDRPFFDPLIVHLAPEADIQQFAAYVPPMAAKLAEKFWPGPLTLVLPKKAAIPDLITSGQDTVGLRKPAHPLTQALLRELQFPLAAPSANPFGYVSPTTAAHVAAQLGEKIPYILDGGPCTVGLESTIIGFEGDVPLVYRLGGMALEDIEAITGPLQQNINQSSNPAAPGQLKSHYAPGKELHVGNIDALIDRFAGHKIGIISFIKPYIGPDIMKTWILSPQKKDLAEAAVHLFSALREADASAADIILAEVFPDKGLGRAINDRLKRAEAR